MGREEPNGRPTPFTNRDRIADLRVELERVKSRMIEDQHSLDSRISLGFEKIEGKLLSIHALLDSPKVQKSASSAKMTAPIVISPKLAAALATLLLAILAALTKWIGG